MYIVFELRNHCSFNYITYDLFIYDRMEYCALEFVVFGFHFIQTQCNCY